MVGYFTLYLASLNWIRGKKEDTEYTKNVKLNRKKKILLGLSSGYKDDKVEMEFVIIQILNHICATVFIVVSLFIELQPKIIFIFYYGPIVMGIVGCLIYRFKKDDFKESKDHYE